MKREKIFFAHLLLLLRFSFYAQTNCSSSRPFAQGLYVLVIVFNGEFEFLFIFLKLTLHLYSLRRRHAGPTVTDEKDVQHFLGLQNVLMQMSFEIMEIQTTGQKVHLRNSKEGKTTFMIFNNISICPFSYDVTHLGELLVPFCDITKGATRFFHFPAREVKEASSHFYKPTNSTMNDNKSAALRLAGASLRLRHNSELSFSRVALGPSCAALADDSCVYKGPDGGLPQLPQTVSQPLLSGDNRASGEGH